MRNIIRRRAIMFGTPAIAVISLLVLHEPADTMNNVGRAIMPFAIVSNDGSTGAANVGLLRGCP